MTDSSASERVIYIGAERRLKRRWLGWLGFSEPDSDWRQRQAQEIEDACQEMSRRGLRLVQIVPVLSAGSLGGSRTEGAWLFFSQPAAVGTGQWNRETRIAA
jgi:hypothetical protein